MLFSLSIRNGELRDMIKVGFNAQQQYKPAFGSGYIDHNGVRRIARSINPKQINNPKNTDEKINLTHTINVLEDKIKVLEKSLDEARTLLSQKENLVQVLTKKLSDATNLIDLLVKKLPKL